MIKSLLFLGTRCLFIIIGFYIGLDSALAQQSTPSPYFLPKIFPQSPNSAALGKYGNYPVNLVRGLPTIAIPLYEIQVGDLNVPISLNYHASGIKVTEIASWAGLGWSVDAGGSITRRVMGNADESNTGYLTGQLKQTSAINPNTQADFDYLINVRNGNYDTQPDIFSYNFSGTSGKFFFNGLDNYKPMPIPFSTVKINKSLTGNSLAFDLIDENGNLSNFGSLYQESTTSYNGGVSNYAVSAWMLEKLISQNRRDTVTFSYTSSLTGTATDLVSTVIIEDNVTKYSSTSYYTPSLPMESASVSNASIQEQKINEIKYKNGKVVFKQALNDRQDATATGMKSLQTIEVYNYENISKQYKLIKTVKFYQSYFSPGAAANTKRLRLDSLSLTDAAGNSVQKYRFNYNSSQVLPANSSYARDYWGYYNGKNNSSLMPQMEIDYVTGLGTGSSKIVIGSNVPNGREPDSTYMQACMLKRIYYPTKGYTDFEFETNRYTEYSASLATYVTKLAGGLRIKSIKSYDGISPIPLVKTYKYTSARPNFFLSNFYFKMEQTYYRWIYESGGPIIAESKRVRTFLSNPTIDIEPYDATPVIYPTVTEFTGDGTTNSGKTDYTFSDQTDAQNSTQMTGKPITDSFFYKRGQTLKVVTYAKTASAYQPVKQEESSYFAFPQKWHSGVGLVVSKRSVHEGISTDIPPGSIPTFDEASQWVYTNYSINSGDQYPTGKVETSYNTNDATKSITTSIAYKYDNSVHQQVSRTRMVDSEGKIHVTTNKYPADYLPNGSSSTGNAILDNMLAKNMQAGLVEKWDSLKTATGNYVSDAQLNQYKLASHGAVVLDKQKKLLLDKPVTDFQASQVVAGVVQADARYSEEISFDTYDTHNNLVQYSHKTVPRASILWDYKGMLPVAEVKNAPQADIAYTSFEAEGTGSWTINSTVRNSGTVPTGKRYYILSNGAISKTGLTTSKTYILSYWNQNAAALSIGGTIAGSAVKIRTINGWNLYEHRITGVSTITVSGTGNLDELRLYPVEAQMTTYTYDPLVGQTATCDANNLITYYTYDAYGRLSLIKDQNGLIRKKYTYQYANQ